MNDKKYYMLIEPSDKYSYAPLIYYVDRFNNIYNTYTDVGTGRILHILKSEVDIYYREVKYNSLDWLLYIG